MNAPQGRFPLYHYQALYARVARDARTERDLPLPPSPRTKLRPDSDTLTQPPLNLTSKHERNRAGGPRATGRNRNQRLRRDRVIDASDRADSQRHPGRLLTHVVTEHDA